MLALERSQIPHPGKWTPEKSFMFALEKVCTSITSGWWREYAWEHHEDAVSLYESARTDYVDRFKQALAAGVVRPAT